MPDETPAWLREYSFTEAEITLGASSHVRPFKVTAAVRAPEDLQARCQHLEQELARAKEDLSNEIRGIQDYYEGLLADIPQPKEPRPMRSWLGLLRTEDRPMNEEQKQLKRIAKRAKKALEAQEAYDSSPQDPQRLASLRADKRLNEAIREWSFAPARPHWSLDGMFCAQLQTIVWAAEGALKARKVSDARPGSGTIVPLGLVAANCELRQAIARWAYYEPPAGWGYYEGEPRD